MTMAWNNRNDGFNHRGGNEKQLFEEHNESVRRFRRSHAGGFKVRDRGTDTFEEHSERISMFRRSHPNDLALKVSRRNLITTMWPLLTTHTMREIGGSTGPARMMDWSVFVPIGEVTARWFSSN